jgi:esterase/lipase superfamily enzyme
MIARLRVYGLMFTLRLNYDCRFRGPMFLRPLLRGLGLLGLCAALQGCLAGDAALDNPAQASLASRSAIYTESRLLVATTSKRAGTGQASPFFTSDRGGGLSFVELSMVPPSDANIASRIASGTSSDWTIARAQKLVANDAATAMARAATGRDVLFYVHGYNETFETAARGAAALADGVNFSGHAGLFAWPSGGRLIAYAYDRESALWSRDALLDTLKALSANPSVGRVHIVAHSMGAFLTLEALRQLRADEADHGLGKIGALVLASPDVDIDQFEAAVQRLAALKGRITVISATNDRALAVSARLAGGVSRAGASERARLEAIGINVADASDYGWGMMRHDLFLTNDDVRAVIARAIARVR